MALEVKSVVDGQEQSGPVTLKPGQAVNLVATEGGALAAGGWNKGGAIFPGCDQANARVVMSRSKDEVGRYAFMPPGGPESAEIEVQAARAWLVRVGRGGIAVTVALVVYVGFAVLWLQREVKGAQFTDPTAARKQCIVFAVVTLVVFLLLVEIAGRAASDGRKSGLVGLISGADRRASTSKVQFLAWTLLVGFILAYIAAFTRLVPDALFECTQTQEVNCVPSDADKWGPYLILLGLPSAALVMAKGLVSYKVANGTLQKSTATGPETKDLITNDSGASDIVDIQYLFFNLIALAYVAAEFNNHHKLAEIPGVLLGLTSTAAATYVFNKALLNNKPRITSVVPSMIVPGGRVMIRGDNILVPGAAGSPPKTLDAKVGGIHVTASQVGGLSDTLTLTAPANLSASSEPTVTVITAADIEAEGFPVSFAPLVILGWATSIPPSRNAAGRAQLKVSGLAPIAQMEARDKVVQVTLAGRSLVGSVIADDQVEVDIPVALNTATASARVVSYGRSSEQVELPLA